MLGQSIMGRVGTAQTKIEAFKAAGVSVAETPFDIVKILKEKLKT